MNINIILADDHHLVREGLKSLLQRLSPDIQVVGEASNGKEAFDLAKKGIADLYVFDIGMPILNGIEATAKVVKLNKKNKVIILSMYDDRTFLEKALKSGAKGYILKDSAGDELIYAIRQVSKGGYFISPKLSRYMVNGFVRAGQKTLGSDARDPLSAKEKEVLQLIAEGRSDKEIAAQLRIAANTAHVHRTNIMRKLDLHKQTDLVRYALKEGLTQL